MSAPTHYGRFEVLFPIASGGMAEVYAAGVRREGGFDEFVAVKRLLPALVADADSITMFRDEAQITSQLRHPNIVETREVGHEGDEHFLIMELVVGATLYQLAVNALDSSGAALPYPLACEMLAQAADGLQHAHEVRDASGRKLQVVHRDVSPQNILVGTDGRVRVADFGIARALMRSTQTRAGQMKGKVGYVSPEHARGEPLDGRADVFALGTVAWETLTGRSLFNTGDIVSTLQRVHDLDIPSVRSLRKEIPAGVADTVMWALQRDPTRRCPSAADFARGLRAAVPNRPSPDEIAEYVRENGGKELRFIREKLRDARGATKRTRRKDVRRRLPRSRTMWIIGGLGLLAWLAVGAMVVSNMSSGDEHPDAIHVGTPPR